MFLCDLEHTQRVEELLRADDECMEMLNRFNNDRFLFLEMLGRCLDLLQERNQFKLQVTQLDLDLLYRNFND